MKAIHAVIFALCCAIYVALLFLYAWRRDLESQTLARYIRHDSLVADFADQQKPLEQLLTASHQNLMLVEALRHKKPRNGFQAWQLIAQTARFFNESLSAAEAEKLAKLIAGKAKAYGLDPLLVAALISQESAFYESARSPVGAYGYGQLMPETAAFLGVDPYKPEENLEGCTRYLSQQMRHWGYRDDKVELALASYNAGPGAVAKYNGVPPYRETITYVQIITARYDTLKDAAAQMKREGRRIQI